MRHYTADRRRHARLVYLQWKVPAHLPPRRAQKHLESALCRLWHPIDAILRALLSFFPFCRRSSQQQGRPVSAAGRSGARGAGRLRRPPAQAGPGAPAHVRACPAPASRWLQVRRRRGAVCLDIPFPSPLTSQSGLAAQSGSSSFGSFTPRCDIYQPAEI